MRNLPGAIGAAIRHFWVVRGDQGQRQGERTGAKDTGNRALVTGRKQMTGFVDLFTRLIEEEGLDRSFVHGRGSPEIEGARQNQIAAFSPVSNLRGSLLPESIRHILHTTRSREAVRFRVSSHIDERRRAQRRIPGTQRGIITVQFRRLAAGPNSHDGKAASKVVLPPIYLLILAPAAQPPAHPAPSPLLH